MRRKKRNVKARAFKGFETWTSGLSMAVQMHFNLIFFLMLIHLAAVFIALCWVYDMPMLILYTLQFAWAWLGDNVGNVLAGGGLEPDGLAARIGNYLVGTVLDGWPALRRLLAYTLSVYLAYPLMLIIFIHRSWKESETRHIRGPQLKGPAEVRRAVKGAREKTDLRIGDVGLPVSMECEHVYIIGTTGTGKTTFLVQTLERLRKRGGSGIIYDFKGDYVSRFYDPSKDVIINPADRRCAGWNLFNEIETIPDIDSICESLIPRAVEGDAKYWNDAARDVFRGILHHLWAEGRTTNRDIWDAVSAPAVKIQRFLTSTDAGKAGLKHIENPNSKQAMGVLSNMMKYTGAFQFMAGIDGDFSFSEWVRRPRGWIYVVNVSKVRDTLRPVLTLAMDLVARETLSLADDRHRRIFMVMDELGTLHHLSSLVDILTLGRSKGASLWLGTQDFGRIKQVYGDDIAETIFNNCSTRICYRVNAPETAEFLEKAFGEREISEVEESITMGPDERKDGLSLARKNRMEKIVLAGEIMELPNLHCYVKMGHYNTVKTRIPYRDFPATTGIFEMRGDMLLPKGTKTKGLRETDWDALFKQGLE